MVKIVHFGYSAQTVIVNYIKYLSGSELNSTRTVTGNYTKCFSYNEPKQCACVNSEEKFSYVYSPILESFVRFVLT